MTLQLLVAKTKLVAPLFRHRGAPSVPLRFAEAHVRRALASGRFDLQPYEHLARVWDQYAAGFAPRYDIFADALEEDRRRPFVDVLDLACGTGRITRQLAIDRRRVIGIDRSAAMLAEAQRRCRASPNLSFVEADFREFELHRRFDLFTCAADSLNYVAHPAQLTEVFRCVRTHARSGALFVFDVLNPGGFGGGGERVVSVLHDGVRCDIIYHYDPRRRVAESRVVSGGRVERHRRVPIDPRDVQRAATETGLRVLDRFSTAAFGLDVGGGRDFYVLEAPEATTGTAEDD